MRKQILLLSFIYTLLLLLAIATKLHAQSITLIPNPDGNRGVKGYLIPYNNDLYFKYQQNAYVLGQYNGIDDSLITNPDAAVFGYNGFPAVYNNALYYTYTSASNKLQLVKYDGATQTLFPNPDSGNGFIDDPTLFNNHLVYNYQDDSARYRIAECDGNTISLVANPDNANGAYGNFIVYNNNLYTSYRNGNVYSLGVYDGSTLKTIPNPDAGFGFAPIGGAIIFQNNLYFGYENISNKYQLAKYDGATLSLLPNPDEGTGYTTAPVIYNGNLYFSYQNVTGNFQLAKYDGLSVTLIPNPDLGLGFKGLPIVYNDSLYFQYENVSSIFQLAKFNGATVSLFPNPEPGQGFQNFPILYANTLYFSYQNSGDILQLAQFKGDSVHLIPNPDAGTGFTIAPALFNGSLYFGYYNASFIPQLAQFTDNTLPLTLLSFSATGTKENTVNLNWQTSTEINTDYFELQRGADATHFNAVAKIAASGNSAFTENYQYTDSLTSFQGNIPPVLYYRLKMTDKDGRFTYSKVIVVKIVSPVAVISVTPNPVQNILSITYTGTGDEELSLNVFDMNGKAVLVKKVAAVKGDNKYELPFTDMPSATYLLQINGKNGVNTIKIIK